MSGPGGSAHPEHTRAELRKSATAGTRGWGSLENHATQGPWPGREAINKFEADSGG